MRVRHVTFQKIASRCVASAPKADISQRDRNVCQGPIANIRLTLRIICSDRHEDRNATHPVRLLRARGERLLPAITLMVSRRCMRPSPEGLGTTPIKA
jgi:hypothetical protein